MVDDRPEDTGSLPDQGRPKREPPTIDLEATEVSSETKSAAETSSEAPSEPSPSPRRRLPRCHRSMRRLPAGLALDRRAGLRRGRGCAGDWRRLDAGLACNPARLRAACPAAQHRHRRAHRPCRRTGAKGQASPFPIPLRPHAPRPWRKPSRRCAPNCGNAAQGEKLASAVNEVKSAPRGDGAASPDLSGIDERIAKVESQMRTQGAEIAQQGSKLADTKADAKPADDIAAAPPGVRPRCSMCWSGSASPIRRRSPRPRR